MPAPSHWVDHTPGSSSRRTRASDLAEVLFETPGQTQLARMSWLEARLKELRTEVGGRGMLVFGFGLWAVTWLAPLWSLRLPSLGRHAVPERREIVEKWERSPFGMTIFAVKAILSILYFEHAGAAEELGFDGQPLRTADE